MLRSRPPRSPRRPPPVKARARPGAAGAIPRELISRMPVVGRWVARSPELPVEPPSVAKRVVRLPGRALKLLKAPLQRGVHSPDKSRQGAGLVRAVRRPLEQTARVVQAAREARRPKTRWERLREAASQAVSDPGNAMRWERLMGLGIALARPAKPMTPSENLKPGRARTIRPWRAAVALEEPKKPAGLRERLLGVVRRQPAGAKRDKKEDGAGKSRGRPLGSRRRRRQE